MSFYELYKKKLTEEQLEKLEISSPSGSVSGTALESTGGSGPVEQVLRESIYVLYIFLIDEREI